jgi:hypothetical protein
MPGLRVFPTCREASDPDLASVVLSFMPVFFTSAPGHPLLNRTQLTYSDIAEFPTLALSSGVYPRVETALKGIGLWSDGVRMSRYRRDRWEGKSESELFAGYGTPLPMQVSGGQLCRLPLRLLFDSGDALVVRKDFLDSSEFNELLGCLESNLRELAGEIEGITAYH